MKKPDVPKLLFALSCVFLVFASGVFIGAYQIFPYSLFRLGVDSVRQVFAERETITRTRPEQMTRRARFPGNGVTRSRPDAVAPGLTFLGSFFDGGNEMRLIRLDGSIVHRWPVKYFEIFPDPTHLEPGRMPQSEWNVGTHGSLVLPDGSIVFNFESLGTVKLDRCGAVQWTVARQTNHSLERASDGGFWVADRPFVRENSPFPLLKPPFAHDKILKISEDGKIVKEMSVLDILFKNDLGALLFSNGLEGIAVPSGNLLHLNDIEELSAEMAPQFPLFSAGDLMLSLRNLNLVLVIDPNAERVKWHQTGPWIAQHDPDFLPNGRISVFSNNNDNTPDGSLLGGSEIIEIDPATRATSIRYGGTPEQKWYSQMMGKHQYLPNGNVLIADAESGRAIEVDPQGEIVWEFINRWDDEYVAEIWGADRYPEDYFTVEDWSCAATAPASS
jgi:hypothetical protein